MRFKQCKECGDPKYKITLCSQIRKAKVQCPCYNCLIKMVCRDSCLPKINLFIHIVQLYKPKSLIMRSLLWKKGNLVHGDGIC